MNKMVESMTQVDLSEIKIPMAVIYVFTGPEKGAHIFDFAEEGE